MLELWRKFLYDLHFVRALALGLMTLAGMALVSPVGRALWEKLLYTAPVAFGVGAASVSGTNQRKG